MRRLLQSRFVANYGMLFVLVLLCGYFSVMTIDEQHPVSAGAAREIADFLRAAGPQSNTLIAVPRGTANELFARSLAESLESGPARVVGIVIGDPADARRELERLGAEGVRVDYIATQYAAARWTVLSKAMLGELREQSPTLGRMDVVKPASYTWPTFLTPTHLLTVANQTALTAIVAIGMTMVIITAGIDLSVGSLIALSGVMAAVAIERWAGAGLPMLLGLAVCSLAAVLASGLLGAFSGILITRYDVPAFIVTLGVMQIARGLAHKVAGGPDPVRVESDTFHHLSAGADLFGIPNPVVVMVVLYLGAHFLMSKTTLGRYLYAVGGNPEAARLSGVPVRSVVVFAYAMSGALAGLGGVLDASLFSSARATGAIGYELQIIAAVVVGGTSLAGGEGKVLGTLIGALILGVISDGMRLTNVQYDTQLVVFGLLIVVAVLIDRMKSRQWG